jgi:hypothetical protein
MITLSASFLFLVLLYKANLCNQDTSLWIKHGTALLMLISFGTVLYSLKHDLSAIVEIMGSLIYVFTAAGLFPSEVE